MESSCFFPEVLKTKQMVSVMMQVDQVSIKHNANSTLTSPLNCYYVLYLVLYFNLSFAFAICISFQFEVNPIPIRKMAQSVCVQILQVLKGNDQIALLATVTDFLSYLTSQLSREQLALLEMPPDVLISECRSKDQLCNNT